MKAPPAGVSTLRFRRIDHEIVIEGEGRMGIYSVTNVHKFVCERCPESVLETNQLSAHFHEHERADTK